MSPDWGWGAVGVGGLAVDGGGRYSWTGLMDGQTIASVISIDAVVLIDGSMPLMLSLLSVPVASCEWIRVNQLCQPRRVGVYIVEALLRGY